jgi:ABC-type amino acid transport substrate-binding protein
VGYENLFNMLAAHRFDAFPRGLNEIDRDLDLRNAQTPALVIEHRHAIYFPYPVYFWVRKDNEALADRIRKGLEAALADGSMRQMFLRYHAFEISQLHSEHRDVIRLPNKRLPGPDSEPDTSWWWTPPHNPEAGTGASGNH